MSSLNLEDQKTQNRVNYNRPYWFVGAYYYDEDQTENLIKEGIWKNVNDETYSYLINEMQPGDKIAIKAAYVRKNNLPFDNCGKEVSTMSIKAIGTVIRNHGDAHTVDVKWEKPFNPVREFYFYTKMKTVEKIFPDTNKNKNLIDFTFNDKQQDFTLFHMKSANPEHDQRFQWTAFYQELATKLLAYKDDRTTLIEALHDLKDELKITIFNDEAVKGQKEPLKDICPFTVFALFNRGRYFKNPESNKVTNQKRQKIAQAIANILDVKTPAPETFEGLP